MEKAFERGQQRVCGFFCYLCMCCDRCLCFAYFPPWPWNWFYDFTAHRGATLTLTNNYENALKVHKTQVEKVISSLLHFQWQTFKSFSANDLMMVIY